MIIDSQVQAFVNQFSFMKELFDCTRQIIYDLDGLTTDDNV